MTFIFLELMGLLSMSLLGDLKHGRIGNKIILFFLGIGIVQSLIAGNWPVKLLGVLIPLVLLYPLYGLKMMGAGDVKVFCAIGGLAGPAFVLWSMISSFLVGGVISLLTIFYKKNSREKLANIRQYFIGCLICFKVLPYEPPFPDKFPFMIAIFPGTLAVLVLMGLEKLNCFIG